MWGTGLVSSAMGRMSRRRLGRVCSLVVGTAEDGDVGGGGAQLTLCGLPIKAGKEREALDYFADNCNLNSLVLATPKSLGQILRELLGQEELLHHWSSMELSQFEVGNLRHGSFPLQVTHLHE